MHTVVLTRGVVYLMASMREATFRRQLARNIKRLRLKAGLVQEDVEEYGVNVKQYQRIERGLVNPKTFTIYKLSKAFKCTPNDILGLK